MEALKEVIRPSDPLETTIALNHRELRRIRKSVTHRLEGAENPHFNNSTIEDIFAASVYTAVEELGDLKIPDQAPADENIGDLIDDIQDSAKKQIESGLEQKTENSKYMRMLKGIGHAGLVVLNYAMIPIKSLYNWIVDKYFKKDIRNKSIKQALKKPDIKMGELNKKAGYGIEKVKKRIYTAIAYIAAGIINAVKIRFYNDERKRKQNELKDKMKKFYVRDDFKHYIPEMAIHVPSKELKPYIVHPIRDNKKRAAISAVLSYMDAVKHDTEKQEYLNRQMGNLWTGNNIKYDSRFPEIYQRLKRMKWRTFAMSSLDIGHRHMLNKH